jgi:signal transduction histidine kinase/FixJ family two-component response regulator/HAMP domain-containing protein
MKIRKRLNIHRRLLFSSLILIFAFTINAFLTYFILEKNIELTNKVFENSNPSLQELERLKLLVNESKMYTTNWVFLPAKSSEKKILSKLHEVEFPRLISKLEGLSQTWNANQQTNLKGIEDSFESLLRSQKKVIKLLVTFNDYEEADKRMQAELILEEDVFPITAGILIQINDLIELKKVEIIRDENDLISSSNFLGNLVIVLSLFLIAVALIFSFFNSRLVSSPIIQIKDIINNLGKGIIYEIPERSQKDEISDMIDSVNQLSAALRKTVHFADQIGKGNFSAEHTPLSDEDTLGKSLLKMRNDLRKGDERLVEAQEITRIGSWEYDIAAHELQFSKVTYSILSWNESDRNPIIGNFLKILHAEDLPLHLQMIERATREGFPQTYDLRLHLENGMLKNIQMVVKPVFDEYRKVIKLFGTILDIDERKKFEMDLIAARDTAEKAAAIKSQFLSNMSHEMRTPMNAIIGLSDLLLEDSLSPVQEEKLIAIKHSGRNLLKIINEILDFSKIEAGMIAIEKISFDLRQVVDVVVKTFSFKAESKNLKLITRIDEEIPNSILGDPYRLNQLLLNLLGNAVKFTERGHVKLSIALDSKVKSESGKIGLIFIVEDTGIGIVPEKHELIFESFSQAQSDHSRKYGGTGLGLSITKKLVEIQGGKLEMNSIVGKGSTFKFYLTFEQGDPLILSSYEASEKLSDLKGLKILLVEDNAMNQFVAVQILKKLEVNIETALNGRQALGILALRRFDLVLMDLQMPEMDGYEATKLIRLGMAGVLDAKIPIIALTADAFNQTKELTVQVGMNGFITKPINQQELFTALLNVMVDLPRVESLEEVLKDEVNYEELEKITQGSNELFEEIIRLYLMELPSMVLSMRNNAADGNWFAINRISPRLNSMLSNLGLERMISLLGIISESCTLGSNLTFIPTQIEDLAIRLDKVYEQLKERLLEQHGKEP